MMFRSDKQRKAMFAAINGVNSFSCKSDNNFALKVVKDKKGLRVRSDEYPEVDVELDQGKTKLSEIKSDLSSVRDQDLVGLNRIDYYKYTDNPSRSSYTYDGDDAGSIHMCDRDSGLSSASGPCYRRNSLYHEIGHHLDRDDLKKYGKDNDYYYVLESTADETARLTHPYYNSEFDMMVKHMPQVKEEAMLEAEANLGVADVVGVTLDEAEDYANKFSKKNVSRGARFEGKIRSKLDNSNCTAAIRSAGSRSLWDIVCITPDKVRLIQAKTSGYLTPKERKEMLSELKRMPDNVQADVEYYKSPKVITNKTIKNVGETDWGKVKERLDYFNEVRGFKNLGANGVRK